MNKIIIFLKKLRISFKADRIKGCIYLLPSSHIEYSFWGFCPEKGFALVFGWLNLAIGIRFYKK